MERLGGIRNSGIGNRHIGYKNFRDYWSRQFFVYPDVPTCHCFLMAQQNGHLANKVAKGIAQKSVAGIWQI